MWNSLGVTASTRGRLPLPRGDGFSLQVDADNPVSIDIWPHPSTWAPEEVLLLREGRLVAATALGTDHRWVLTGADRFGTFRALARSGEKSVESAEFVIHATSAPPEPSGATGRRETRADQVAAFAAAASTAAASPPGAPTAAASPPETPTPQVEPPTPVASASSPSIAPVEPHIEVAAPAPVAPAPVAPPSAAAPPPAVTPPPASRAVPEPPPRVIPDPPPRVITDQPPRVIPDESFPVPDSPTPLAVPGTPSILITPATPTAAPGPSGSRTPLTGAGSALKLPEGEYDARFAAWVGVLFTLLSAGVLAYLTVRLSGDPGWPEDGQPPVTAEGDGAAATTADVGTFAERVGLATSTLVIGIGAVLLFAGAALGALEVRARQRRDGDTSTEAPTDTAALRLLPKILFQTTQIRATVAVLFAGGIILTIGILGQLHWASQI